MFDLATKHKFSDRLRSLLGVMMTESACGRGPQTTAVTTTNCDTDKSTVDIPAAETKIGSKRGCEDVVGCRKRLKVASGRCDDDAMPLFYYNLHKRKVKGVDLPK